MTINFEFLIEADTGAHVVIVVAVDVGLDVGVDVGVDVAVDVAVDSELDIDVNSADDGKAALVVFFQGCFYD